VDAWDYRWVRTQLESTGDEIDSVRDNTTLGFARMERQLHALAISFNALVELLVEDGKLSIEDLRARVDAALIADEHERKLKSDPAQDVWDAAKPR
jgi:hypothetical protein